MKIILFGATGMVGGGVLREALLDPEVVSVLSIVRRPSGQTHEKLRELVHDNFFDFSAIEHELKGYNACIFCLGVSSFGMNEAEYTRITYTITTTAAGTLLMLNPAMKFIYISGASTDSTEQGKTMWARVKGKTENALLKMPFKASYMVRPGFIQPMHGIQSRTFWIRFLYAAVAPITPWLKRRYPKYVTSTDQLGRALLKVAKHGAAKPILENQDIALLAG